MNSSATFFMAASILAGVLVPQSVPAHDLVLIPETQQAGPSLIIKYGHPADFHLPDTNKVIELTAWTPTGSPLLLWERIRPSTAEDLVVLLPEVAQQPGLWIVSGRYDNGYWVPGFGGHYFNTSKRELPEAKHGAHYFKFSKAMFASGNTVTGFDRIIGHRLEIIPQSNPFALKAGDQLAVLVRFEGKPLANVGLEIGDNSKPMKEEEIKRYLTDDRGIAKLPIQKSGFQFIAVDYVTASPHPDLGEKENYTATLTFVLP